MTLPIAACCKLVVHIAVIALVLVALGTPAAQRIVVSGVVEFAEITEWVVRLPCWLVDHSVPVPTAILSTSPGKYRVLWRVESFDFERQGKTLKQLAITFGGGSRLHQLQPGAPHPPFPESEVRSGPPRYR